MGPYSDTGREIDWDAFPVVQRLHERSTLVTLDGIERVVARARCLLEEPCSDAEDAEGVVDLRQHVQKLRRTAIEKAQAQGPAMWCWGRERSEPSASQNAGRPWIQ